MLTSVRQTDRETVVAETVVGATTGVVAAPKGYFKAMKSVCDKYGALFILDEVMSGMGRKCFTSVQALPFHLIHSIAVQAWEFLTHGKPSATVSHLTSRRSRRVLVEGEY
jgi:hypothetical protein